MRKGFMKRKILAGFLAFSMVFVSMPASVQAAESVVSTFPEMAGEVEAQENASGQESTNENSSEVEVSEKKQETETPEEKNPETETSEEGKPEAEAPKEDKPEQAVSGEEPAEMGNAEETKPEQGSTTDIPEASESTEKTDAEETVSGNDAPQAEESVSENDIPQTEESISENAVTMTAKTMSGEGTTGSPYLITTEAELIAVADDLNKVYSLQNDIALSNEWTPIGTYAKAFSGTFDGNGHTISVVVINSSVEVHKSGTTSYKGSAFFGRNNGTIKNLTIKGTVTGDGAYSALAAAYNTGTIENVKVQDAAVTGKSDTGLLAGYNANSGVISGCSASGAATCAANGSGSYTGGLTGANAGKITGCSADVTVSGYGYTGGFAGYNSGSIEDSSSTGKVSSSWYYTGGFVGRNVEGAAVVNCSAGGAVSSKDSYTGGFAGANEGSIEGSRASGDVEKSGSNSGGFCGSNSGRLTRCLSEGSVNSTGSRAGGFVGNSEGGTAEYSGSRGAVTSSSGNAGGFAGYAGSKSMIVNCYANGDVAGSAANVGGFIGYVNDSPTVVSYCYSSGVVSCGYAKGGFAGGNGGNITFLSCYYDKDTSGLSDTGNGEPKSTAEMKQQATYAGWGFGSAWGLESGKNNGYPYLLWEGGSGAPKPVIPSETLAGEGTNDSPYLIKSEADLLAVGKGLDKAYRLENDILLSDTWIPVGTYAQPFSGTFDGNGHTITGIVIKSSVEVHKSGSTSYQGSAFFGRSSGTVRNLRLHGAVSGNGGYSALAAAYSTGTLDDVSVTGVVTGKSDTGLLAGYNANSGVISGCSASGAATCAANGSGSYTGGLTGANAGKITEGSADVTVSGYGYTGGFAGYNSGSIEDSSSTGKVSSSWYYTGGFVGRNVEGAAVVNCSAGGAVSSKDSYTGGFAGANEGSIEGSRASGDVEKSGSNSGGFCGSNSGRLTRCLSEGSVNSTGSRTGGFVGNSEGGTAEYSGSRGAVTSSSGNAGGFAGYAGSKSMIVNCYANGDVAGSAANVGGFIGYVNDSPTVVSYCYSSGVVSCGYAKGGFAGGNGGKITFLSCYYDKDASGLSDTGNGEPKSTAEMKQQATYEGWGFGSVWGLESAKNDGYPYLLWEEEEWVSVKGVSLTPTSITLKIGESRQLTAEVTPENANDKSVTWKSSNDAVATVQDGVVTAVKAGTAKITVTTVSGGRTADCDVTVAEEGADICTVKFETNGADRIEDVSVTAGEKLVKPADPSKEGYRFGGWYKDAECTQAWDFENETVTADLTLYAKWTNETEAGTYTVKFETNGAAPISDAGVVAGEKLRKPADPIREGYEFGGWYKDAACTQAWNFENDMVTADMTLYAKWIENGAGTGTETERDYYSVYEETQRTNLSGCTIASVKSKVYDGKVYTPTPKVTLTVDGKSKKLVYGTDYRMVYENHINAGTGTVTVVGIGNYCGRKAQSFTITKKSMSKLKTVVSSVAVGEESAAPIAVYDGTKQLQKGVDYDYQFTAAHAGSPGKVTIEVLSLPDSNYAGTLTAKVPVIDIGDKTLIRNSDITLSETEYKYNGSAHKPDVTVRIGEGALLERNKDYSVTYKNNKNAGMAYVIVKGKGKLYTGTATAFFLIKPAETEGKNFDSVVVNKGRSVAYNGKLQKPAVVVRAGGKKLSAKKDYMIEYTNNLVAGTGYVKVTGMNNYEGLTSTVSFTINPISIKKASIKVRSATDYTLKFKGRVLIEGVDYEVLVGEPYSNGKVDVTFKGLKNFNVSVVKKKVKPGSLN